MALFTPIVLAVLAVPAVSAAWLVLDIVSSWSTASGNPDAALVPEEGHDMNSENRFDLLRLLQIMCIAAVIGLTAFTLYGMFYFPSFLGRMGAVAVLVLITAYLMPPCVDMVGRMGGTLSPQYADTLLRAHLADARANSKEEAALAALGLKPPATWSEIRTRYKELAKRLHPDANGGDPKSEERLKQVNQAYGTLKAAHNA
jgi:hypothetical protein